jgi:D-serine deaminase-like pyridoxal phosphate-dependent protein
MSADPRGARPTAPATLDALETPAGIVDLERVRLNLARAASYAAEHGLAWRPHAKTHKSRVFAEMQMAAGAVGLTVATLAEAETLGEVAGDLLLAYPPLGEAKLARLMAVPATRLTVMADSSEALDALARAARAGGREVGVLVEVDAGMGRVGVTAPGEAVALARRAEEAGLPFRGIGFYPGHVRARLEEQTGQLRAVSARVQAVVEALDAAGLAPRVVSGGSTPTLWRSHEVAGITEIRPGTSIFNDRATELVGACSAHELAYTVLATVVSTAVPGQAVVDAGSKALGREDAPLGAAGFAALLEDPRVVVRSLSEEHGILDLGESEWRPRVGDRVRIVPNHVCISVNLQEGLWLLEAGEEPRWSPVDARHRLRAPTRGT